MKDDQIKIYNLTDKICKAIIKIGENEDPTHVYLSILTAALSLCTAMNTSHEDILSSLKAVMKVKDEYNGTRK